MSCALRHRLDSLTIFCSISLAFSSLFCAPRQLLTVPLAQGQIKKAYDLYIASNGELYLLFAREAKKPFAGASYLWKIVLAKWDKNGRELWEKPLADCYGMDNRFSLFSGDSKEEIFIRGVIENRFILWKFGAQGEELWKIESQAAFSLPERIAIGDGAGGAYVVVPTPLLLSLDKKSLSPLDIIHYAANGKVIDSFPLTFGKSPENSWLPSGPETLDTLEGICTASPQELLLYGYSAGFGPYAGNVGHTMDYGWLSAPLIVTHVHIFLRKCDTRGRTLWNVLIPGNWNNLVVSAFAGKKGELTVCGVTSSFSCPDEKGRSLGDLYSLQTFVFRYSSRGEQLWCKQFGSGVSLSPVAVESDSQGNCYVLGEIKEVYPLQASSRQKPKRVFLASLNARGDFLWIKTFGTAVSTPFSCLRVEDASGAVAFGLKTTRFDNSQSPQEEVWVLRFMPGS
jgi:hypothetical protein